MNTMETHEGVVLLVDDQPESIDIIKSALDRYFTIKVATRGELAMKVALKGDVDLILLDVVMPGMDGYEICRQLKENNATRTIPVIFLTGRDGQDDEAIGLALGAVDFIRKPSSPAVVLTRCRNTIAYQRAKEDLRRNNIELQQALKIREDMERLSRHDLKGPLSGVIGIPQLLLGDENLTDDQRDLLGMLESSGYAMLEMINRSLDLYKMETGNYVLTPEPFNLVDILKRIAMDLTKYASPKGVRIVMDEGMENFQVVGEKMLCYPLFSNVILNAIEASCHFGEIKIHLSARQNFATIRITNSGEVPHAIRGSFFEKYVTYGKKGGTGLGTYSAWLAAKAQGGSIELDTNLPGETTLVVNLPLSGIQHTLEAAFALDASQSGL